MRKTRKYFSQHATPLPSLPHALFYSPCTFSSRPYPTLDVFASFFAAGRPYVVSSPGHQSHQGIHPRHHRGVTCKAVKRTWSCWLQVCECACIGECIILFCFFKQKYFNKFCSGFSSRRNQTNTGNKPNKAAGQQTTEPHGSTAPRGTAQRSRAPRDSSAAQQHRTGQTGQGTHSTTP